MTLGIAMDQSWDELICLGQAALLHDAGKYKLSRKLIYKEAPLTPTEQRVLERHVEYGLDALKNFQSSFPKLNSDVYQGIRCHHERWDGGGYPQGLKGKSIPLVARILAVADSYESMTTDRCYRRRLSPGEAYRRILDESGKTFDPLVVAAFRRVIIPYPNQSLVELDFGQVAQVVQQGAHPEHPVVQLGLGEGSLNLGTPGSPQIVRQIFPRRHPRVPLELPAAVKETETENLIPGRLVNLSLGGACVALSRPLPVGTRVSLCLVSDDMQVMTLNGVVAWRMSEGAGHLPIGIRFEPLGKDEKALVEQVQGQPRSWSWQRT